MTPESQKADPPRAQSLRRDSVEAQALALLEQLMRCPEGDDPRRILVEGLRSLDGVCGAWLGRPDRNGRILFGTVSDPYMQAYLGRIEIRVDHSLLGQGAVGRAWRSARVEWVDDWLDDPAGHPWREAVLAHGFRSSAAIVLHGRKGAREVLALYSECPGWFSLGSWPALIEHVAAVFGLVLEDWDLKRRLEELAHVDALTELPNRRALEDYLETRLARAHGHRQPFALGMIDLDNFKPVNDRLGHAAGDRLLTQLARRMRASLRQEDFLARLGGDEFTVVFNDFNDPDDLKEPLARLHQAIIAPLELEEGETVRVDASLGLALWPQQDLDRDAGFSTLLLRADLALYQAKRNKLTRANWWSIYAEGMGELPAHHGPAEPVPAYGDVAVRALRPLQPLLPPVTDGFVEALGVSLTSETGGRRLFRLLSTEELEHLKGRLRRYFEALIDPRLEKDAHDEMARRAGRINAGCSFDPGWITGAHEMYLDSLFAALPQHPIRLRQALPVISARLARDRRSQLRGYRDVAEARNAFLERFNAELGQVRDSLHVTEMLVEGLAGLNEIAAVCATRPGPGGRPIVTAISGLGDQAAALEQVLDGEALAALTAAAAAGARPPPEEGCHLGHCVNFAGIGRLPPRLRARLRALRLRSAGLVSWPDGRVPGQLWLFSYWPGGFSSREQRAFLRQVGQHLALGWTRLPDAGLFTVGERRACRAALRADGLVMHYQPVIDLRTGGLVKVEALARLRQGDELLSPDRFLPVFDNDDLFLLYQRGLRQALADARDWAAAGQRISLGLNVSPRGLGDPRYVEATAAALAEVPLPQGRHLYLEMLETEHLDLTDPERLIALFQPWLELGAHFAQDDLGAGHSSLLRLHRLPFEVVKIDQALVRSYGKHPDRSTVRKILAFIADLTNLAHVLGVQVCVEGLESDGLMEAAAALGADFGQGYAIARPMPAEAVVAWAGARAPAGQSGGTVNRPDYRLAYRQLHEAVETSGINSRAYTEARRRLYDVLGEHIAASAPQVASL